MKKLITLVYLCTLYLGLIASSFSALAIPQESVSGEATAAWPSCPTCDDNRLGNASFETSPSRSDVPTIWKIAQNGSTGVELLQNASYKVCDDVGATFEGNGYFYQDVTDIVEGDAVTLKIFGARHQTNAGQKFELQFLNASGTVLTSANQYKTDIDNIIDNTSTMKLYTITTGAAPAGTAKVRVRGYMSTTGGWIKVDAGCLTVLHCETCTGNKLSNPGFETTEVKNSVTVPTIWKAQKNSTTEITTESSPLYKICGVRGATFSGNGYLYQEVAVAAGSNVTLTIWGARHEYDAGQTFQLVFLDASNVVKGTFSTPIEKDVDVAPWGLEKYTINVPFAPDGTTKVSIRANMTRSGGWIKLDQACLTVVEQCACDGNKLENGSFESVTTDWKAGSPAATLTSELPTGGVGCGVKFGVLTGAGGVYQSEDFKKDASAKVELTIWGATNDASKSQFFKLTFYNGTQAMSSTANKSVEVNEVFVKYLTMYNLSTVAPANATSVRLEIVNTTGASGTKLYIDQACLKITVDGALPVTLTDFAVTKEKSSALLTWSTTAETNASEFEVQQSENGKAWSKIGSVEAKGESSALVRYNFVHNEPADGNNFYRLKMIDLDNTYSFSRILTVNFENAESVQVYPNPTSDFMKLTIGKEKIVKVQLYNAQGVMMIETKPDSSDIVDLRHLKSGSYIVKIKQASGLISTRRIQVVK